MIRMKGEPNFKIAPKPIVFLATPTHLGLLSAQWVTSVIQTQRLFSEKNIGLDISMLTGDPMICRARNRLVNQFLRSEATHMLFVDDDISWRAEDLVRMLSHRVPFVGGAVPAKTFAKGLQKYVGVIESDEDGGINQHPEKPLIRAERIGTGFMLIERKVFHDIEDENHTYQNEFECPEIAFFHTDIFDGRYIGEDYVFCEKWKQAGGEIWLDTLCVLGHVGRHMFTAPTLDATLKEEAA